MDSILQIWNNFTGAEKVYIICLLAYIPILIVGMYASTKVKNTFLKYNSVPCGNLTASEVARKMLDEQGLQHISIQKVKGTLTDCYDPRYETINLSDAVYGSNSVAAVAVACHECGHAIQYSTNYPFAKIRRAMVPVLNFANKLIMPLIVIGLLLQFLIVAFAQFALIFFTAGSILFGLSMLFSLITLPTEFDASKRANNYVSTFLSDDLVVCSKKVLNAAAMTYVVAFLMSLVQFLRFFSRLLMLTSKK